MDETLLTSDETYDAYDERLMMIDQDDGCPNVPNEYDDEDR